MKHDWKMEVYWRLPVRLQEAVLSLYAGRLDKLYYGEEYVEWKRWTEGWEGRSPSSVERWKNERLQYIVQLAAEKTPFYRDRYKGVSWRSVKSDKELCLLPTLDKQSIRQNEQAFLVGGKTPKALWVEKTSGTTGTSLKIYWPKEMVPRWWAVVEVMVRRVAGVAQEMPRAMMGGRPIVKGDAEQPPYWRFNRRWRQLYLSSYHVSPRSSACYIEALKRYRCEWMYGYGSAIAALADDASRAGLEPPGLRSVIVSGDTLLPPLRRSIEGYFNCKCYDHYGQSEGVAMAMECGHGRIHVIPQVGIVEILGEDGGRCRPGETGQIIATSLLNDAMPLIRYRTGDYGAWSMEKECPCGNPNPMIGRLEGRVDDYLVTGNGRRIGRLSTALKRCPSIHSAQIVQHKPGHAYLLVRPGEGYRTEHALTVREDIRERIGGIEVEIVEVAEIPKTPQGKAVLVVRLDERPSMRGAYEKVFYKNKSLRLP